MFCRPLALYRLVSEGFLPSKEGAADNFKELAASAVQAAIK
jgi:hypothetical protein